MFRYKLYQISRPEGEGRRFIIADIDTNPVYHLELNEAIETDCWLSDVIGCGIDDIQIIQPHYPASVGMR